MENELQVETPYDSFVFAIRSPVSREKYLGRLAYFMTYVGIREGNIEKDRLIYYFVENYNS